MMYVSRQGGQQFLTEMVGALQMRTNLADYGDGKRIGCKAPSYAYHHGGT